MAALEMVAGLAQQQTLSPQMQQSLQLLQAPVAELRQLVSTELASNPVLEEEAPLAGHQDPATREERAIEKIRTLNEEWRDYMPQSGLSGGGGREDQERRQTLFDSLTNRVTLRDFVVSQSAGFSPEEQAVVEVIAGNLDKDGYLRTEAAELAREADVDERFLRSCLEKVRSFDPPGVAAVDLADCLLLQLSRAGEGNGLPARLLRYHLPQLARHRYQELSREIRVPVADIKAAARRIAALEPLPGRPFEVTEEQGVIPDLIVIEHEERFLVRLNEEELPRLRINQEYKDLLAGRGENEELLLYLREKIKGARVFLRSLQQRQQTLLAIGNEIVARQEEFFRRGPAALKPLIMSQVADAVGLHVTTVSRAVSGKFMETPRGFLEMRYFFTPGFQNSDGTSVSNESVKDAIREIVEKESASAPLSDQEIVSLLDGRGLRVARRTIAKYRDQLGILPSHLRKNT
jgi:RNA polymerase sigma-54 factor